jgi:uncharacterized membrane protein HdeD (DUF308 family)
MTTLKPHGVVAKVWKSTLTSGVLTLILGSVFLIWPDVSWLAASVFLSVYLLLSAATQVIVAFALSRSLSRALLLVSGAASVMLAVLAIPGALNHGEFTLSLLIASGFLLRGIAETVSSIIEQLPGRPRQILMGVITVVAGVVVVLEFPFANMWQFARIAGPCLVVIGISEIASSFGIRRAADSAPGGHGGGTA